MINLLRGQWGIAIGAMFAMIAGAGALSQVSAQIFMIPVTTEFGWSRAAFSAGLLVSSVGLLIMQPIFGWLMDNYGVRRAALPFALLLAAAYASFSFMTGTIALFYLIYLMTGIAGAAQTPPTYAKMISMWFGRKRGIALGVAISGASIGHIVLPLYAHWMIDAFGWRLAYVSLGLLNLVFLLPILLFVLREPPEVKLNKVAAKSADAKPLPGLTLKEASSSVKFWTLILVFFLVGACVNGVLVHLAALLTDLGWNSSKAVALISAAGLANIAGRLVAGWILDSTRSPAISSMLFLLPALAVLMLASGNASYLPYIAVPLLSFAHGADGDILAYYTSRFFGVANFGQIYGIGFTAFAVGAGVGPILLGRTHDVTQSYSPALIGSAVGMALVSVLVRTIGDYAYHSEDHGEEQNR